MVSHWLYSLEDDSGNLNVLWNTYAVFPCFCRCSSVVYAALCAAFAVTALLLFSDVIWSNFVTQQANNRTRRRKYFVRGLSPKFKRCMGKQYPRQDSTCTRLVQGWQTYEMKANRDVDYCIPSIVVPKSPQTISEVNAEFTHLIEVTVRSEIMSSDLK